MSQPCLCVSTAAAVQDRAARVFLLDYQNRLLCGINGSTILEPVRLAEVEGKTTGCWRASCGPANGGDRNSCLQSHRVRPDWCASSRLSSCRSRGRGRRRPEAVARRGEAACAPQPPKLAVPSSISAFTTMGPGMCWGTQHLAPTMAERRSLHPLRHQWRRQLRCGLRCCGGAANSDHM